jgi:hypothetical protein
MQRLRLLVAHTWRYPEDCCVYELQTSDIGLGVVDIILLLVKDIIPTLTGCSREGIYGLM